MIEVANDQELASIYDVKFASEMLELVGIEDTGLAEKFSSQLWDWAITNNKVLRDELEPALNPDLKAIRKEVTDLRDAAHVLQERLINLSGEVSPRLCDELSEAPANLTTLSRIADGNETILRAKNDAGRIREAADTLHDFYKARGKKIRTGGSNKYTQLRDEAVAELAVAWLHYSGKLPTQIKSSFDNGTEFPSGKFYEFCLRAIQPIVGEKRAEKGLDAAIEKAIKRMKMHPENFSSLIFEGGNKFYSK
jgi:hypothetical protein